MEGNNNYDVNQQSTAALQGKSVVCIQEQETDDYEIPDTVIHSVAYCFWQMMQNEMKND